MRLPLVLTAGLLFSVLAGPAAAADEEPTDLPEGMLAKMARMRAKGDSEKRDRSTDAASRGNGDQAACGSLNIGNVEAPKPGQRAPKEVIVVIKGPVVNANNKCSR